jgi:hypothetical protein
MGIFVYFANKSLGQVESFLEPGRNLVIGLIFSGITAFGWYFIRQSILSKSGYFLFYLPLIIVGIIFLYFFINLIFGAKWN